MNIEKEKLNILFLCEFTKTKKEVKEREKYVAEEMNRTCREDRTGKKEEFFFNFSSFYF